MCIYIPTRTLTHLYIHTFIYIYLLSFTFYMHAYIYAHDTHLILHTNIHAHVKTHPHKYIHTYMHTYIQTNIPMYQRKHIDIRIYNRHGKNTCELRTVTKGRVQVRREVTSNDANWAMTQLDTFNLTSLTVPRVICVWGGVGWVGVVVDVCVCVCVGVFVCVHI